MKLFKITIIFVLGAIVLSGCGGGGGSAETTTAETTIPIVPSVTNQAPTADAGADKTVQVSQAINITGSGSDTDGSIKSYQWKKGNTVLASTASFSYTPTTAGTDTLTFTVTDNGGETGSDTMNVTAINIRMQPLIIIRIEFNDYQFTSLASVWSQKIFGTNEGQLNHYYNEISYRKFQLKAANETDGVNDGVITVQLDENHPGVLEEKIDRLRAGVLLADASINFSQYDTDKNGVISSSELQIMFLVAGGERATGANPGIWAHASCMQQSTRLDNVNLMNCSDDGVYSAFGEKHFDADSGSDATIGVIAHELGHAVFALPDLYDTDDSSAGIGNFGLMGGGSWGQKEADIYPGATPVHMTGWSKEYCGFVVSTVASASNLQINATSSAEYKLYQIPTGTSGEYFLVENRAATGYDRGLYSLRGKNSGSFEGGLSILHIDNNKINCIVRNDCNNDETHKLVDVEEANNNLDLDKNSMNVGEYNNLYFSGNSDSFTSDTAPNSNRYDSKGSGVRITNVSGPGPIMSVDIEIN